MHILYSENNPDVISYRKSLDALLKNDAENMTNIFSASDPFAVFKHETIFCIMTPQSTAKAALKALEYCGSHYESLTSTILTRLGVRFPNNKSKYIQEFISTDSVILKKEIEKLIENKNNFKYHVEFRNIISKLIKGIGLKEASHVCRNIGIKNVAIIDRHILTCMLERSLITSIPKITRANYDYLENLFLNYSSDLRIPPDHLDMLWWSSKSGMLLK